MSSKLGKTDFTIEWLKEVLTNECKVEAKLLNWTATPTGEGVAFLSNLVKVDLEWDTNNEMLPRSVVVKVPTMGNTADKHMHLPYDEEALEYQRTQTDPTQLVSMPMLTAFHKNEINMYMLFGPNPPIPVPQMYYGLDWIPEKQQGVIVLSDVKGFEINMMDGLSLDEILQVIDQIAKLQAFSMKLEPDWVEKFEELQEINRIGKRTFVITMKNLNRVLKYLRPELFTELVDKSQPFFNTDVLLKACDSHIEHRVPPVLTNGDLWPCNLLWTRNGSTNQLAAILDWQMAAPGNCCQDIGRLLATSMSCDVRRKKTHNILKFYHNKLCQYYGSEPFSFEKVKQCYNGIMPFTMMFMTMGVPMWNNIPKLVDGPKKEKRIEEMYKRAVGVLEDFLELYG